MSSSGDSNATLAHFVLHEETGYLIILLSNIVKMCEVKRYCAIVKKETNYGKIISSLWFIDIFPCVVAEPFSN